MTPLGGDLGSSGCTQKKRSGALDDNYKLWQLKGIAAMAPKDAVEKRCWVGELPLRDEPVYGRREILTNRDVPPVEEANIGGGKEAAEDMASKNRLGERGPNVDDALPVPPDGAGNFLK